MSILTPGQEKFAGTFSKETGLDPRVVGSWLLAEQSGSAAKYYEDKGYNNYLNIANTDSGPASGAHSSVWSDPESAAKASAEWIKGHGKIASEYGTPAEGIRNILHSAGKGYKEQIQAISGSGWASSGYNGGKTLEELYGQLSGHQLALISSAQRQAGANAGIAPVIPETSTATPKAPEENPINAITAVKTGTVTPGTDSATIAKNWELLKGLFDTSTPIAQPSAGKSPDMALPNEKRTHGVTPIVSHNRTIPNAHGGVGFTPGEGKNYSYGNEPLIAQRANALAIALGLKLRGESGYRTPAHSEAVGGFADDPHTRGEASDTPGIEEVPEATLNQYGLERPFDKIVNGQHSDPAEADHIQLLGSYR